MLRTNAVACNGHSRPGLWSREVREVNLSTYPRYRVKGKEYMNQGSNTSLTSSLGKLLNFSKSVGLRNLVHELASDSGVVHWSSFLFSVDSVHDS